MSQLQIAGLTAFLGPIYLACLFLIGSTVSQYWHSGITSRWEGCAQVLLTGLLAHAAVSSVLLLLAPEWLGASLWILLAGCLCLWRWKRPPMGLLRTPLALVVLYSLACYLLLLSYHYGPARGPTVFWSIYNLTHVTPGDSPQAAFQAQYLLYGKHLTGAGDFALFDRPFLGGIITAGALPSFGIGFESRFYDYPDLTAFSFASLWIAINAVCALALLNLVERFTTGRVGLVVGVLLLVSPFLVFNTIGLWSKLLALALMYCACTHALRGKWLIAMLLSSASFFAHGSFLWAHISFCGVLVFTGMVQGWQQSAIPWLRIHSMLLACVAAPAAWFIAEHLVGGATPLRAYYLYNVDVNYGLHHSAEEIARTFYASTSMANLTALPWVNMLKGILPIEILDLILNFQLSNESISWRKIGESLFRLQFMRVWFAFGLVGGFIAWRGLCNTESTRWLPRLMLIALFLLPMIPGLGLYRRDDHFLLPIMMFALIPVLVSFCIGLRTLQQRTVSVFALVMLAEFLMVYVWRYPPGRYVGEFHAYYLALVALGMCMAAVFVLWPRAGQALPAIAAMEKAP